MLLGTISRRDKSHASSREHELPVILDRLENKDLWPFGIHEETTDELAENLMNHLVCTLDISPDEEPAAEIDEGEKENVPPLGYNSQPRSIPVAKSLTVGRPQVDTGVRYWREIGGNLPLELVI